jgi:8-oxo-dGTP pyrophosphatase MutT (NUDIX family)
MKQGSAIIIKNSKGELLLQHRDNNAPTDKNTWAMWGGTKEGDETPVETAARELKEELNIEVEENHLNLFKVYVITFDNLKQKEVSVFELQDEGDFKYELCEGDDLKFFSPQEIKTLQLDSVAGPILADYLNIKS